MNGSTEHHHHSHGEDRAAQLLTPAEVAQMFHVDPKTVTRWAQPGKLSYMRTLGGHRRYHRHEVDELLRESTGGE